MQITLAETARRLGCGAATLRARLHNEPWLIERLGAVKFANVWAFDPKKVDKYAKEKKRST